jgi:hypothetical protein
MDENKSNLSDIKPETHLHKSMRGALRWALVALLAFGLGALLIAFALFFPARQKLDKANLDLVHANATITRNETLQKNLDSATLHMYLFRALSGVRAASLAGAADDYAGARLSLTQASGALDVLSVLLGTDQKDVISAMQQSAVQALTELKTDLKSAQPELDQLTKNLVQLENNLFPNP